MDQLGLIRDPAGSTSVKNMKRNQILSVVGDEFSQEEFSDESINVGCVLSFNLSRGRLRVDFHGEHKFDSETSKMRPERIKAAMEKITELYG